MRLPQTARYSSQPEKPASSAHFHTIIIPRVSVPLAPLWALAPLVPRAGKHGTRRDSRRLSDRSVEETTHVEQDRTLCRIHRRRRAAAGITRCNDRLPHDLRAEYRADGLPHPRQPVLPGPTGRQVPRTRAVRSGADLGADHIGWATARGPRFASVSPARPCHYGAEFLAG